MSESEEYYRRQNRVFEEIFIGRLNELLDEEFLRRDPHGVPGFHTFDGFRIKRDEEIVGARDLISHSPKGNAHYLGQEVIPLAVGMKVLDARIGFMPRGGYILTKETEANQ